MVLDCLRPSICPEIIEIDATLVSFPPWGRAPFPLYGRPPGYKGLDCLQSAAHALRKVTGEKTTVVTEFSFLDPCNRA